MNPAIFLADDVVFLCLALLCRILVTSSSFGPWGREAFLALFFSTDLFVTLVGPVDISVDKSECFLWLIGEECEVSESMC